VVQGRFAVVILCTPYDRLSSVRRAVILAGRPRRASSIAARVRGDADAHVVAEHLRAFDLVARAGAAVATADATGPREPSSIRGAGSSSPPLSGRLTRSSGATDSTRAPFVPAVARPAVAYDLPKNM